MLIFPNLFPKAIGIDRGFRNPIAPAIPIDMPHTKPIEIPICDSIGYRPLCGVHYRETQKLQGGRSVALL